MTIHDMTKASKYKKGHNNTGHVMVKQDMACYLKTGHGNTGQEITIHDRT